MARACIFCGEPPTSRGDGEHVFPKWLNKVFPIDRSQPPPSWIRHNASDGGNRGAYQNTKIPSGIGIFFR